MVQRVPTDRAMLRVSFLFLVSNRLQWIWFITIKIQERKRNLETLSYKLNLRVKYRWFTGWPLSWLEQLVTYLINIQLALGHFGSTGGSPLFKLYIGSGNTPSYIFIKNPFYHLTVSFSCSVLSQLWVKRRAKAKLGWSDHPTFIKVSRQHTFY